MLGLHELTGDVALPVHDSLGLAGGPARERDQAGILRVEVDRGGGVGVVQSLVGDREQRTRRSGGLDLGEVALVGDDRARLGQLHAQAQVAGAQLLVTRQRDGADAHARNHRVDPLGPVADHGQDHVAAVDRRGG